MKHTPKVVYRDSGKGIFVTPQYAATHKKTTEREIVYTPSPKKG